MAKTPKQTWTSYGVYFQKYANKNVSPELLAAIAQKESSGNPFASPQWKFQISDKMKRIYAPITSAFGLMQITNGTFTLLDQVCHNQKFAKHCPFLPTRASAKDSIALASLNLSYHMNKIRKEFGFRKLSGQLRSKLAAVVHLCGYYKGRIFASDGFKPKKFRYCGSHLVSSYIRSVLRYKEKFRRYSQGQGQKQTSLKFANN